MSTPRSEPPGIRQSQLRLVEQKALCFQRGVKEIPNHNLQMASNTEIANHNNNRSLGVLRSYHLFSIWSFADRLLLGICVLVFGILIILMSG